MAYEHAAGIRWVGQLSDEDADVLAYYGKKSRKVLEFGAGGSTHIFAQTTDSVLSIENVEFWKDSTQKRLENLGVADKVEFMTQDDFYSRIDELPKDYDFIFIDGEYDQRYDFALRSWDLLNVGGYMAFHDTSRQKYFMESIRFIFKRFYSCDFIKINPLASNGVKTNITIVKKRLPNNPVSWANTRSEWSLGMTEELDRFYMCQAPEQDSFDD